TAYISTMMTRVKNCTLDIIVRCNPLPAFIVHVASESYRGLTVGDVKYDRVSVNVLLFGRDTGGGAVTIDIRRSLASERTAGGLGVYNPGPSPLHELHRAFVFLVGLPAFG